MKATKIITTLTATLLFALHLSAQTQVGIKAGLLFNNSSISGMVGNILPDTDTHLGYNLGIFADFSLNQHFSFHPEFGVTTRGFSMNQSSDFNLLGLDIPIGVRAETNMKYIETLALIRYKIGTGSIKGFVEAGPGIAYATSAYIQPKATLLLEFNLPQIDINLSDNMYNRRDITASIGTGMEYYTGLGVLFANVRYSYGMSNVLNNPIIDTTIKHRSYTLGVGYGYDF